MMEETDVVTDQRCCLEFGVNFDVNHGNGIIQDHGVESVKGIRGKTLQTDGSDGDDGSHVQGEFGRRLKTGGLIYPGNYPDRIMPKVRAELRPEGRKAEIGALGEVMDSSTETTLLLVLGLICVATLVLLPIKEDEDASGIQAGIQARVRGSHSHGGQR